MKSLSAPDAPLSPGGGGGGVVGGGGEIIYISIEIWNHVKSTLGTKKKEKRRTQKKSSRAAAAGTWYHQRLAGFP